MDTVVTGAAFGAALVASGMYSPYLIASQFSFEKWNMIQTFLTATGCTALSVEILRHLGLKVPPPRPGSSVGLLGFSLDGNLIGGALLGAGMSLSAACPGMVFPQLAMGVPSAPMTLAGACAGGVFWSAALRPWIAARKQQQQQQQQQKQQQQQQQGGKQEKQVKKQRQPPTTLAELAGAGQTATLLAYEAALAILVAAAATMAPSAPSALHPVAGGLAIGGAQLVSLLLRGSALGVSTCYEHVGDWAVWLISSGAGGGKKGPARPPGFSTLAFSAAMMAGARLLVWARPELAGTATLVAGSPLRAFVGGFLMALGSRVAGGCTSGHGISGMGLMSVSSFVSMVAAFSAAIAVTQLAK
ncbi:hypothetical protein VSDG_00394 [Cytospora chrysosperma]|uniref:Uncharacterized protein n=1 Tax=Cytospora chrysosperma TaxID=252740 RepID=A0A423WP94_CYTCH|nr:hypothetical protein VSDG_00394 [Valsa sordida]